MATILLVPGAWHGRWCWELLIPRLEALGHRVVAPELLAMGDDPTPLSEVTLARWADQVAAVVADQAEPVVLLGHSRGGIVVSEVAERVPESIGLLIYLAAFMLPDGMSLVAASGQGGGAAPSYLVPGDGGLSLTVKREAVGEIFYNTSPAELVRVAQDKMGPEPSSSLATPLKLSAERYGSVPRAYIECLQDKAVPIAVQRQLQAQSPCREVVTLDTDHCPFFSAPDELAAAVDRLAAAGAASRGTPHA